MKTNCMAIHLWLAVFAVAICHVKGTKEIIETEGQCLDLLALNQTDTFVDNILRGAQTCIATGLFCVSECLTILAEWKTVYGCCLPRTIPKYFDLVEYIFDLCNQTSPPACEIPTTLATTTFATTSSASVIKNSWSWCDIICIVGSILNIILFQCLR